MARLTKLSLTLVALASYAPAAADREEECQRSRCVVDGLTVNMAGDSNTRFHSFNVQDFLSKCTNEDSSYNDWGNAEGAWKTGDIWTTAWGRSTRGTHLQGPLCKGWKGEKYPHGMGEGRVCFYFTQSIWYTRGGDPNMQKKLVEVFQKDKQATIYNGCWWDAKSWSEDKARRDYEECGAKMDPDGKDEKCERLYQDDYEEVEAALFKGRPAVFRASSFGGDYFSSRTESGKAVEACNRIAKRIFKDKYVDVYENWFGELDQNTVDGTHATRKNYEKWTMAVMRNLDKQLGTGCFEDGPAPRPEPTPRPRETPRPSPAPQTKRPTASCKKDDKKWYVGKKKQRNCKWAKKECKKSDKRCKKACKKKGKIGGKGKKIKATEACCKTCADYA